jgi:hypothetical protein
MMKNVYHPAVSKNMMPEAAENFKARYVTAKFRLLLLALASSNISIRWVKETGCGMLSD